MSRLIALTLFLLTSPLLAANAEAKVVLFDEGHAQAFTVKQEGPLQLGNLATILRETGLTVRTTQQSIHEGELAGMDALIISGAFRPYSRQEITAVKEFLQQGGRVAIMLHIAKPMWGLLDELGVDVANGVLRDPKKALDNEPTSFEVSDFSPHPLTRELQSFNLYGGWPLRPAGEHAQTIARSSAGAWVDLNHDDRLNAGDVVQQFGVIVSGALGAGEFIVFADDASFQNRFLDEHNRKLADNLGDWLAGR